MENVERRTYKVEVCVESFEEAMIAAQKGADQIELCSHLELDGLTPSLELFAKCRDHLDIHIKVMIRPRPGDFDYSSDEIETMIQSIRAFQEAGAREIVTGATSENKLNLELLRKLQEVAAPMEVTVHKAIDTCIDPVSEITRLKKSGVKSILTSGGQQTAEKGKEVLKDMIREAGGDVEIIPAGKILPENIQLLHAQLDASTYHGRNIL
jgi:copper homeostasis protein